MGRHAYHDHDKGHIRNASWLPRLTPASVIGMGLFFFFSAQLFTTTPFQRFGGSRKLAEEMGGSTQRVWTGSYVKVSKSSHAYLRDALWNRTVASFTKNVSSEYEEALARNREQLAKQDSFFKPWIEQDLQPWKESGITKGLVEAGSLMYDICDGDMFRFQILNGSLWVHHVTDRRGGWYPAVLGPENVAAKGRVPYALLAIMETLKAFPGQIPDLDAVFMTADFPCIRKKWAANSEGPPVPMFGYQGSIRHHDLPFPDYAFWGHEYQYLQDPWGSPVHGWQGQAEVMIRKYENVSLLDRIPQAMWRGRTKDKIYPHRDHLRRKFVECVDTIKKKPDTLKPLEGGPIKPEDASLISVVKPPVALQDNCDYRYPVYIESDAYANNLKTKLACGSVLVVLQMEYWEFYARALQPGKHYVEVTREEDHVCEEIVPKVKAMNAAFETKGMSALRSVGELTPTLEAQLHAMRGDKSMSALLSGATGAEAPQPGPGGNYTWGSPLYPWQIAANGQQFVEEHLGMEDTLLYIRDLLKSYAALQKFQVKPHAKAICYTGDLLLQQFGTPHKVDGEIAQQAYPWLKGYNAGCKEAEAVWGTYR